MENQNLDLIKQSFPLVFQRKSIIASHFYAELFRLVPEARPLFRQDMSSQKEMLATVLTTLAKASFDPERMQEVVARMAHAHDGLGITEAQLRAGERALCHAVTAVIESKVSSETLAAWHLGIRRVIDEMIAPPGS